MAIELPALSAVVPVRDRVVAVDEPLASMLPDGGLQRGRIVGCEGPAALSLAFATVAAAARAGSWLALVGMPMVGVESLAEFGVPLDRVVAVDGGTGASAWAERVAAAADGFELIVTQPPHGAERVDRRLRQRLQARGVLLVAVGADRPRLGCDLTLSTSAPRWDGIGAGHGRLAARTVELGLTGRRMPRPVVRPVHLPALDGRMSAAEPVGGVVAEPVDAPDGEVLDRVG